MPDSELTANTYNQQLRKHPLPPIDWLRERYEYDPETGIIWHRRPDKFGNRKRADGASTNDYYIINIPTKPRQQASAHRLAFALINGRWPTLIDHIDRDKTNNRWNNLRETTHSQNMQNRTATHIRRQRDTSMTQGFAWQITVQKDGEKRQTTRRDFCAAWKIRQAWLAERQEKAQAPCPTR